MIPASFLVRARRHLRRTGQPLLLGPRRRTDLTLIVDKNVISERWAVLIDPRSVPVLLDDLAEAVLESGAPETPRFTILMLRFSKLAAIAVRGLPDEFRGEDGGLIGRMEVVDNCTVYVSGALALSCLSHVLRHSEPRTGFFLRFFG
jgi:hypothetical protein